MEKEFDVVIAGGGIAGMTAGVTSVRLGRTTLVLTGDVLGGQLVSIEKIEGFPGFPDGVPGYDLCPMMQEQAVASGAEVMMNRLECIHSQGAEWRVTTEAGDILARSIILATGSTLKKLNIPGEERLTGRGVSHCASCDAPLLRDRIVAIVGGGDSATQEALTLAGFASKVIIIHRGGALAGQASYRDRVTAHPRIDIRFGTAVSEILGESTVTSLRTHNSSDGVASDLEVAAVFAYVGLQPNTTFLKDWINLDPAGRIPTDGWMRTGLVGVCAAGNVRCQSPIERSVLPATERAPVSPSTAIWRTAHGRMAHGKTEKSTKQAMATGNYSSAIRNASFVFAGRQHDRFMRDMPLHAATRAATKLEWRRFFCISVF